MRIIGAIGKNGSGKDEVLRYLSERYSVSSIATGDIVRSLAAEEGIDPTRENLRAISARVFGEKGPGALVRTAAEEIARQGLPVAGISGVRSANDVRLLWGLDGRDVALVHVVVTDDGVRFERMRQRAETRDPVNMRHFRELDRREEGQFHLPEAATLADYTVANDGTLNDLHTAIDRLVRGGSAAHIFRRTAPARRRSCRPQSTRAVCASGTAIAGSSARTCGRSLRRDSSPPSGSCRRRTSRPGTSLCTRRTRCSSSRSRGGRG